MTYVPGFKYDVFISYAHADDAADPQGVQWVSDFQLYLKRALKRHLAGYEPDVFFDAMDLQVSHSIRLLLANARQSAAFLPIISPSYLERPWPNDELLAFSEAMADADTIFAIELLPPLKDYPVQLRDIKRKEFWWKDEKQGSAPRRCTPQYENRLYSDYVDDIAYSIAKRLREMRLSRETGGTKPAGGPPGKTVLLAEVTDELRRTRRQVREYLEQYGFNVLPKRDYPEPGAEFVVAFDADLARADLFVQLLGEVRSIKAAEFRSENDPEPKSQGQYQYEAAVRRGIPLLQWRGPEIDPAAVPHWDQSLLAGPQVLAMGLQEFMKEIKKFLDQPSSGTAKKRRGTEFVFINVDQSDKELSDQLLEGLKGNPDLMVMEPLFKGSADQMLEDLEANLKACAGLLLVYGNSAPPWVRAQLRRYTKLESSREEPVRVKTIMLGPPPPKSERDLGSATGFTTIDCQNGITAEHVQQIVAELRK